MFHPVVSSSISHVLHHFKRHVGLTDRVQIVTIAAQISRHVSRLLSLAGIVFWHAMFYSETRQFRSAATEGLSVNR
jgi:hypothetical protein